MYKNPEEMRKWNIRTTFLDIFKPLEKVKINTTGSSYCKKRSIRQSYESGAKFSILIKGKPGFVQLASAQIRMNTPLLEVLSNVLLDCG